MTINTMNAGLSWLSMFIMMWMWNLGMVEVDVKSIVIFCFFLVVAVFSGAAMTGERQGKQK